jgi:hypothetical protein
MFEDVDDFAIEDSVLLDRLELPEDRWLEQEFARNESLPPANPEDFEPEKTEPEVEEAEEPVDRPRATNKFHGCRFLCFEDGSIQPVVKSAGPDTFVLACGHTRQIRTRENITPAMRAKKMQVQREKNQRDLEEVKARFEKKGEGI